MQTKLTAKKKLLNPSGELNEPGYATELLLDYHRQDIKAKGYRIKEWDYYLIANDDYAVALTIADNSYMGLLSISFIDFKQAWFKTESIIKPFTFGKLGLPSSSKEGDIAYTDNRISMAFLHEDNHRRLRCSMKNFHNGDPFACDIILSNEPRDSMVIATPFPQDRKAFYYNQKINCMRAQGEVVLGEETFHFDADDSFAVLDWGRGVWTYKNTWYWGSTSGMIGDKTFGFNIGYGFGNTSAASENMLFYDGVAHKLDKVEFHIPMNGNNYDYLQPWSFTSNDNRFEMNFKPILDRADHTSVGLIASDQHQVFGKFTGKAVLDNGKVLDVKDFLGFAERVYNRW
ncbi:DUF2804 domain-containing protein [Cytobacillus purgationiresistens]|uniref:DUF2804 domain-containing protein n=1 Tax=Cytobacillus purgationiresistens TaxID=863449 RepID=A0ABU0AQV0_9BACI|nr:DUF2804 domain-containing protein [Cytobacillus purgationiresistens]MDQ0273157.1 hypothetical protein [Cytobacillus purgationiresistens]